MGATAGTPTAGLTFLSWYRTGLSAGVAAPTGGAPLDTPPPVAVIVPVSVAIGDPDNPGDTTAGNSARGTVQIRLHAPGDVSSLDATQVIRTSPTDGATNVSPDSFPLIEFARSDIPWMLSPTGPQTNQPTDSDPRRGLIPWLSLVAVPEPAGLNPPAEAGALPTLTVIDTELPSPAAAWLWAHAQVTTFSSDTDSIPDLIKQQPERALSRVIAPRFLRPSTSYLVCLVPTFDPTADPSSASLGWAWQHSTPPADVTLPVYYSWRFTTTAAEVDFRTLVLQLKHWDQGGVGVRPMDIGNAGAGMPSPAAGQPPWTIGLEGSLVSADVAQSIGSWSDPTVKTTIEQALAARVDGTAGELSPPTYGATQASFHGQLAGGQGPLWLRTLNLDPRYRAAASLGAELVRANQEALILSAWDQAGQINAANLVLRQGQLARELGNRTYASRIGAAGSPSPPLEDDRLLQLTQGIQGQVAAPATATTSHSGTDAAELGSTTNAGITASTQATVADALANNETAAATVSVAFRRIARATGPLAARLTGAPLPPPVSSVAAPGGIKPTPTLAAVSGLVDLTGLSADSSAPETLLGVTQARVTATRFPWEAGAVSAAKSAAVADHTAADTTGAAAETADTTQPPDMLLQPGYLSDMWVVNSSKGRALDWDGQALLGWGDQQTIDGFSPGPAVAPGGQVNWSNPRFYGGAASLINWNVDDASKEPAIVLVTPFGYVQETTGDNGTTADVYVVRLDYTLRGDLIAGVQYSPIQQVKNDYGVLEWPTVNLMSFEWGPGHGADGPNPLPALTLAAAVSTGDLTGDGAPSLAAVWSVTAPGVPSEYTGAQVKVFLNLMSDPTYGAAALTIEAPLTVDGQVQSAAIANRRLFVLVGGQLVSAPITYTGSDIQPTSGSIGSFATHTGWEQVRPDNLVWAAITAADFSGSGRADLLLFYAVASTDEDGATTYQARYRIAYELDDNGDPAHWGDEVEADVSVDDRPTSLVLGALDPQTTPLREATSQFFRAAASATQTRLTSVIPTVASAPPQPSVDTPGLATAVRAGVDPAATVPASVIQKLSVSAELKGIGGDELQQIAFTPSFPQPFYETVRDGALWRLVPGLSSFPDESITVLSTDSHEIEAVMVGANHELSREMLWRGVPALRTATFFARFWDGRDASGLPAPDITDISSWGTGSDLGSHAPATAAPSDAAILLIRGELIRRFPHLTIYAAPAVATSTSRTVDLTQSVDPLFAGTLGGDSEFVGFPFTVQSARSAPGQLGMYFVFQEHPMAPRFGLNLDEGEPSSFGAKPAVWRDLDWAGAVADAASYDALTNLDASSASPLWGTSLIDVAGASTQHRWGFSAAHMGHICYRPPVLIAIHADELLTP